MIRRLLLAAMLLARPASLTGQRPARATEPVAPDTGVALTSDMKALHTFFLGRIKSQLERHTGTFLAIAAVVPDPVRKWRVIETGVNTFVEDRTPASYADSLRSDIQSQAPFRAVGVVVDSIDGPISELGDGFEGEQFPRRAIAELEDRSGRCRRVVTAIRWVEEPKSWGFGSVVFDPPVVTRCEPRGYWPAPAPEPESGEPKVPKLRRPIHRRFEISSLDNTFFGTVGRFTGRLTVLDDSIVVRLDTIFLTRMDRGIPTTMRLDSLTIGIGLGSKETTWSPYHESRALRIRRPWPIGSELRLPRARLVIRHERQLQDPERWLIVTIHQTTISAVKGGLGGPSTTYAHSVTGILAEP